MFVFQGTSVLSPLFPIAAMLYMAYLTATTSSTSVFHKHPCLFVMAFGMACSKITIKLVVCAIVGSVFVTTMCLCCVSVTFVLSSIRGTGKVLCKGT